MSYALTATTRTATGRRAKHVKDGGNLPGVMYGSGAAATSIQFPRADFRKVYRAAGMSSLIDVTLDGKEPVKAIIKEVQVNPLNLEAYHVDLHQVRMDQEMTAEVPLVFVGESTAVKGMAGTLVHPMATLKVRCLPAVLPHEIQVDISILTNFEISITVESLKLGAGITVEEDPHALIATVTPPMTEEQLLKMEADSKSGDVTAIKTEAEEKKAAEAAKKAEEEAAAKAA